MSKRISKSALFTVLALIGALAVAEAASAVLSGRNGRIIMVSGRAPSTDATAKLYMREAFGSVGAGTAVPVPTATGAAQHRHPTWSPDRTRIAYAHGTSPDNFDIFILDVTNPNATPQNITNSNNVTDDRPAWSPDGTTIAFESENTDGSGQLNIKLYDVAGGSTTDFTSTTAGTYEHKPAWTPNSQSLFYTTGNPTVANSMNIVRQTLGGGGPTNILANPAVSEFQPSVSPDGSRICFTQGSGFDATARVRVGPANGAASTELPGNAGIAGYNCTWSPDGLRIAYVQGIFSTGDLMMENSDLSIGLVGLEQIAARFDGNPDWAPDGRPSCEDLTVETDFNSPVSIPLQCADTGPNYEQTETRAFVPSEGDPENGTIAGDDPPAVVPADITYTPNPGFVGTDTFTTRSFDLVGFGDRDGTVTVRVKPDNEFTLGKVKRNKKRGTAKLAVTVPGKGDLDLKGSKKLRAATARARNEGTVQIALRAKGKFKKKLKKKGKAKVRAQVTYTPDDGDPNTKSKQVTLKRKR